MNLLSLILYGVVNIAMVLYYLSGKGRFYQFPFWTGMIALGWFFPQAVGGYFNSGEFPANAYSDGMFFAASCTVALWVGFEYAVRKELQSKVSWLGTPFNPQKLYYAGAALCLFGFFFQWKLWSLPEEMLAQSQWSGATVKYLFLASVFKMGFIALWLLYLSQSRIFVPKLLIFLIPCMLMFFEAALFRGRRAGMMDLVSYIFVCLWFTRRISLPRWVLILGLSLGLVLINGIQTYRLILMDKDASLSERLSEAARADYLATSKRSWSRSGAEFKNFIYYRQIHAETGIYDFGIVHWNRFVYNYVPAQIVGRGLKKSLMLKPTDLDMKTLVEERYGHHFKLGTTTTGYKDAFGSFGWFGGIKFLLIGLIMGTLYRHAIHGSFFGQLLYVYLLTKGMQCVSHGTNGILVRGWIYFFALGYPVLIWARIKNWRVLAVAQEEGMEYGGGE